MTEKFISSATKNSHGQFAAKAKAAGMSTRGYAEKNQHAPGKLGKQARLALTLMGFHHSDSDNRQKLYGKDE